MLHFSHHCNCFCLFSGRKEYISTVSPMYCNWFGAHQYKHDLFLPLVSVFFHLYQFSLVKGKERSLGDTLMSRLRNMYAWTSEVDGINKWNCVHWLVQFPTLVPLEEKLGGDLQHCGSSLWLQIDSFMLLVDLADCFQMFWICRQKKVECGCHVFNHDSAINLMLSLI